jgi:hypothetical protein
MTEFMKLLKKVEKSDHSALLWGIKTLVKEFTQIFISKNKHCNFLGFVSITMNLSSFLHVCKKHAGEEFYNAELAKLEELKFLK